VAGSYDKLVHAVMIAWAQVKPQQAFASGFNLEYFMAGGHDDRLGMNNKYFIYYCYATGGLGAMYGHDGRSACAPVFGLGVTNQSIEQKECMWPVSVMKFAQKTDSMGAGQWRGGTGIDTGFRIENGDGVLASYCGDRGKFGPGAGPRAFSAAHGASTRA